MFKCVDILIINYDAKLPPTKKITYFNFPVTHSFSLVLRLKVGLKMKENLTLHCTSWTVNNRSKQCCQLNGILI